MTSARFIDIANKSGFWAGTIGRLRLAPSAVRPVEDLWAKHLWVDNYVVVLIVAGCTAFVGGVVGGTGGSISVSFLGHRKVEHPESIWRSAHVRTGLSLVAYAALMAVGAFIARPQTPDLDWVIGAVVTVGSLIPLLGMWSGFKLLRESQRQQRRGRLI